MKKKTEDQFLKIRFKIDYFCWQYLNEQVCIWQFNIILFSYIKEELFSFSYMNLIIVDFIHLLKKTKNVWIKLARI